QWMTVPRSSSSRGTSRPQPGQIALGMAAAPREGSAAPATYRAAMNAASAAGRERHEHRDERRTAAERPRAELRAGVTLSYPRRDGAQLRRVVRARRRATQVAAVQPRRATQLASPVRADRRGCGRWGAWIGGLTSRQAG